MARKKVTSVPALADWGAVDNALRDIRECQHTLAEMAVQRDRQIDSIKADYAQGALPLPETPTTLYTGINAMEEVLWSLHELWRRNSIRRYTGEICAGQAIGVI